MEKYYAGFNHLGIDNSYNSPCWVFFAFSSKITRDEWVDFNKRDGEKIVAEALTTKEVIEGIGAETDCKKWYADKFDGNPSRTLFSKRIRIEEALARYEYCSIKSA